MDVEEVSVNSHEHKAFTLKGWDTLVAWGPIIRRVSFDAHSTHQMYFRQKQSSGVSAGKKHRDVYWCSTASTCSEAARRQQRVTQTHGRQWTSERRFKSPSGATWGPEVSRTQTPCDIGSDNLQTTNHGDAELLAAERFVLTQLRGSTRNKCGEIRSWRLTGDSWNKRTTLWIWFEWV